MAVQMYLVHPQNNEDEGGREAIAELIARYQGFILMATSYGSLIVAFDEQYVEAVRSHSLVELVGGLSLNSNGPLATHFQRLFARNVALQLASRGTNPTGIYGNQPTHQSKSTPNTFPPGYRPLRWPQHDEEGGD